MNNLNIFIIILIIIIFFIYYYQEKEHFRLNQNTLRSAYSTVPGLEPYIKKFDEVQNYANQVAYGLQHPIPNSALGYSDAPWNPDSYTLRELPNGQFVGDISPN
jgi:hypothetical protein